MQRDIPQQGGNMELEEISEAREQQTQERQTDRIREIGAERYFKEEITKPEKFFQAGIMHLAGSGICLPDTEIDRIISELIPTAETEIESHQGCGAGKIQVELEAPGQDPEEFTIEKTKKIAARNGIRYAGHRMAANMKRPSDHHDAQICYYDGTGFFNAIAKSDLPRGFVVTRALSPALSQDVDLSEAIAFGAHGLGEENFNPEKPFLVIALGHPVKPDLSAEKLVVEARQAIADKSGQRVRIEGFTVPAEWLPKPREIQKIVLECIDEGCCS